MTGSVRTEGRQPNYLYMHVAYDVGHWSPTLGSVVLSLRALDLAYQFGILLLHPEYEGVDLTEPFWLPHRTPLSDERQLLLTRLWIENPLFVIGVIPAAALVVKGCASFASVAAQLVRP